MCSIPAYIAHGTLSGVRSPVIAAFCDVLALPCPEVCDVCVRAERARAWWSAEIAVRAAVEACELAGVTDEAGILAALPEVVDCDTARQARLATQRCRSVVASWAGAAALASALSDEAAAKAGGYAARAIRLSGPKAFQQARTFLEEIVLEDQARTDIRKFREKMANALIAVDLGDLADDLQYRPGFDGEPEVIRWAAQLVQQGWPLPGGPEATPRQRAVAVGFLRVVARMTGTTWPRDSA